MRNFIRLLTFSGCLFGGVLVSSPSVLARTTTSTGVACTKVGTAGKDTINGTSGNDVICGLGGNDVINGLGGNDILDGGAGNDILSGGAGNDQLLGGAGSDTFTGGTGSDTASFADHNVGITANLDGLANDGSPLEKDAVKSDIENLAGGQGNDKISGNAGANLLSGGAGDDTINGGAGNDTESGGDGADTISGGANNDTVSGGNGDDVLAGNAGADIVNGDAGLNNCSVDSSDISHDSTCDIGGPRVKSFSLDRTSIDTSSSNQVVSMTLEVTDDLSGIGGWGCWAGAHKVGDVLLQVTPTDGLHEQVVATNAYGKTDVIYTATFTFPIGSSQGDWVIGGFDCRDNVNNEGRYFEGSDGYWTYRSNDIEVPLSGAERIPISLVTQTGTGDAELPLITELDADATTIDTSNQPVTVNYTAHLTDDFGIKASTQLVMMFQAESGALILSTPFTLQSGTLQDGTWTASVTYPQYWPQGTTSPYLMGVRDVSGKEHRYGGGWSVFPTAVSSTTLSQTGIGDSSPPVVQSITLVGTAPNTRSSASSVTLEFTVTDDLSGALWTKSNSQFIIRSRTGNTSLYGCLDSWNCGLSYEVMSGSTADHRRMIVRTTITMPVLSALGTWDVMCVNVPDAIGNQVSSCPSFSFVNG